MTKNPKAKGNTFERDVCRLLSKWVSLGNRDDIFWRTAGSGGRATQRAKQCLTTENAAGDINCLVPEYDGLTKNITFELKRGYNAVSLDTLFTATKNSLYAMISQSKNAATQNGISNWAVIHKPDRKPAMLYCNLSLIEEYQKHYMMAFEFPMITFDGGLTKERAGACIRIAGMLFDDFLSLDPRFFCELKW